MVRPRTQSGTFLTSACSHHVRLKGRAARALLRVKITCHGDTIQFWVSGMDTGWKGLLVVRCLIFIFQSSKCDESLFGSHSEGRSWSTTSKPVSRQVPFEVPVEKCHQVPQQVCKDIPQKVARQVCETSYKGAAYGRGYGYGGYGNHY